MFDSLVFRHSAVPRAAQEHPKERKALSLNPGPLARGIVPFISVGLGFHPSCLALGSECGAITVGGSEFSLNDPRKVPARQRGAAVPKRWWQPGVSTPLQHLTGTFLFRPVERGFSKACREAAALETGGTEIGVRVHRQNAKNNGNIL